jgi:radical SAM superfamily enzyme YgiQ (UPF0313 family)
MKKTRILFIYPNFESEFRIPLSVTILSACLKKAGHIVDLFDTTFMTPNYNKDTELMEQKGLVEKTDLSKFIGEIEEKDIPKELLRKIDDFKPDLIALSLLERNFFIARDLMKLIREHYSIPIIVGGILPTIVPEMMIKLHFIDIICIGEGEGAIVELADKIANGEDITNIRNLWIKKDGKIIKNPVRPLVDLNDLPHPDWSLFDKRHMWKPFVGRIYKGGSFEFSRGCLNNCTFCVAPSLRMAQGNPKPYLRRKSTKKMVEEIKYMKKKYDFNMVSFCDTNFLLLMDEEDLKEFENIWLKEINLPFTIQSEAKTITDSSARILKNMGCVAISIGVESGSKEIREKIMCKYISDKSIFDAFNAAKKYGIRATANYIVGVPFETEKQIIDSIDFNLKLNPESIAVHHFTPFLGTNLYEICVENGFIKGFTEEGDVYESSTMNMPQISKERINELVQLFINKFNKQKVEI